MVWVLHRNGNDGYHPYIDIWSPDLGNQRWYRRLDDDGIFRYRVENLTTGVAGLFGTVTDSNPPAQIVTDQVSVQVNTSDDVIGYYRALLTTTRDLAARLAGAANHLAGGIQQASRQHGDGVSESVGRANTALDQASVATDEGNRTRLIRLGIRHILDAHSTVYLWAHPLWAGLGAYHRPVETLAVRGQSLANQLYQNLG